MALGKMPFQRREAGTTISLRSNDIFGDKRLLLSLNYANRVAVPVTMLRT